MQIRKLCLALGLTTVLLPLASYGQGGFFDDIKKNVTDTLNQTKEEVKGDVNDATSNLTGAKATDKDEEGKSTELTNPLDTLKDSAKEKANAAKEKLNATKEQITNTVDTTKDQVTESVGAQQEAIKSLPGNLIK